MTKKELITMVQDYAKEEGVEITKNSTATVIDAVFDVIADALANGESISIHKFGTFKMVEKAPRICRNPQTGEQIEVPARKMPKFAFSSALKSELKVEL